MRKDIILKALADHGMSVSDLDAVSGRGGLLRPIAHGTYGVNETMREDLMAGTGGDHASNLGALIARELVGTSGKPAFIVDPVVVDEAPQRVKITGMKVLKRNVISHALNQIATARRYAEENETFYEYLNLIVCHMGGGITVGAHAKGRYIDVNNGLDGEGPFSPQRSGSEPTGQLIRLCFSGKYTEAELLKLNKGRGGLIDLLGTADFREVERRVKEGEPEAVAVYQAMVYQIAKNITALIPAFDGEKVDQILLTGGLARSEKFVSGHRLRRGRPGLWRDGLSRGERDVRPGQGRLACAGRPRERPCLRSEGLRKTIPEGVNHAADHQSRPAHPGPEGPAVAASGRGRRSRPEHHPGRRPGRR